MDTSDIVIVVRVVPGDGQDLTPDELARVVEWCAAQMAGEIEELAAAVAVEQARRAARFRAATCPCLN